MTGKDEDYFEKKVQRLLDAGAVEITDIGPSFIWAKVEGDTDTYLLKYDRRKHKWNCSCTYKSNYEISDEVYCTHMEAADIVRVQKKLR